MPNTFFFERHHDILINVPPDVVFDYVTNPNSWPEWLAASHHIDSPDRPLGTGDEFQEKWHPRSGETVLNWIVTSAERPTIWIGETEAPFLGPIIVRYDFEAAGPFDEKNQATRYRRNVTNPTRPKPPTEDMVQRFDEEAVIGLGNIKSLLENRDTG